MATSINNLGITFPDATTQTTAPFSGITTVTLSTATPNATLTSASNQYIRVVLDTTTPYQPSITLPNMTTLTTGTGRFIVSNETGIVLAVKDNSGTVREYLSSYGEYTLNITSVATSTGVWYFSNSPALTQAYTGLPTFFNRAAVLSSSTTNVTQSMLVRLDSTSFAYCFKQEYPYHNGVYAELFTLNPSTGAFTLGNKVTLIARDDNCTGWDTDDAGHALIMLTSTNTQIITTFGLSVSGGVLYASAGNSIDLTNGNYSGSHYVAYLGSNNAYAYGFTSGQNVCCNYAPQFNWIRGCTVTGTTAVTMTQSASNSTVTNGSNPSRTSLTTFTFGAQYISYTPSTNTYTKGARTTANDIESSSYSNYCSGGQYGWSYCSGKVMQGGIVYDVTNAGLSGVTAVISTSFQVKPQISTNYMTISQVGVGSFGQGTGFLASSTKNILLTNSKIVQVDPSSSTMKVGVSGGAASGATVPASNVIGATLIMSAAYSIGVTYVYGNGLYMQGFPIATSIV